MNSEKLISYYNKFCEDKRLDSRHGQVEFAVTMNWLTKFLNEYNVKTILDVGAGTGRYSFALKELGFKPTAVELVKYNLGILKSKDKGIPAVQGDARNLKKFDNGSFDAVLLFGPMYHLLSYEDKLTALSEAKRVVKNGGVVFISYLMADYAIIVHGFRDGNILNLEKNGLIDENYNVLGDKDGLYSYVRLEDVRRLSDDAELSRLKMVAQDGPTDYIRPVINKMADNEFKKFIDYQIKSSERAELLGASSHVLDILIKK